MYTVILTGQTLLLVYQLLQKRKLSDISVYNDEQERESWFGIWGQPVKAQQKTQSPFLMNTITPQEVLHYALKSLLMT